MFKKYVWLLSIVFLFSLYVAQSAGKNDVVFYPGEVIEYEVSFMGIKLGNITITSNDYVELNGKKLVNAVAEMKSAKGIPFVDLHGFFESWFAPNATYTEKFVSKLKESGNSWRYESYDIDNTKKVAKYTNYLNKKLENSAELKFDNKVLDGCSLFFFARQFTDLKKTIRIPTLMNQSVSYTNINLHGKKENTKVDAVKYPIKCLYFDGRADWEGIYGLKGYFQGWFSDDEARVPIKALMNVYVGNVEIQLVKWKRGDWQPPKGN
ncbi:MAG TPA: DUF3108 domain-containing protein [Candidatus Kapabacteria bacterium]|nr:DUF3108 domain-containing protein [Candidatus Kapabacteria bacterium]